MLSPVPIKRFFSHSQTTNQAARQQGSKAATQQPAWPREPGQKLGTETMDGQQAEICSNFDETIARQ